MLSARSLPLCLLLLLPGLRPARAAPVSFSVRPMLGTQVKSFGTVPVRVDLRTEHPFRGRIVARFGRGGGASTVIPVNAGQGTFRYEFAVMTRHTYRAEKLWVGLLTRRGRVVVDRSIDLQVITPGYNYSPSGRQAASLAAWAGRRATDAAQAGPFSFSLSPVKTDLLPRSWHLYEAIDTLIVPSEEADALAPEQVGAMLSWVRAGGRLVVDSSAGDQAADRNELLRRLDIRPAGPPRQLSLQRDIPIPPERGARRPNAEAEQRRATIDLLVRPVRMGPVLCDGDKALRTETPLGIGSVVLTCVDLSRLATEGGPADALSLLGEIVAGENPGETGRRANRNFNAYAGSWQAQVPHWAVSLFRLTGLEPIPGALVVLYLVIFIAVVCPVEYVILKRRKRLSWMWGATTVTVVIFCLLAGSISALARGTRPRRSMLCIHHYAEEKGGKHLLYDCFVPSRSRAVTAQLNGEDALHDVSAGARGARSHFSAPGGRLEFSSPVWSPHFLVASRRHERPAPFRASLHAREGHITGTLEASGPAIPLRDARLVWNGKVYRLLRQGETWALDTSRPIELPKNPHYGGNRRRDGEKLEAKLITNLCLTRTQGTAADNARLFFMPGRLPGIPAGRDRAVLIATVDEGETLDIMSPAARTRAIHVVWQVLPVSEKGDPDGSAS